MVFTVYPRLPAANVDLAENRIGSVFVDVELRNASSAPVEVAAANVEEIAMTADEKAVAHRTSEERRLVKWRKVAQWAIMLCMEMLVVECCWLIFLRARFGFDAINNAFFWTEVALVLVAFTLGFLASVGIEARSSALLVPFLMFFLPRVTVAIIFYGMDAAETTFYFYFYSDYVWICVVMAFTALFSLIGWFVVLGYYRQLTKVQAVDHFVRQIWA